MRKNSVAGSTLTTPSALSIKVGRQTSPNKKRAGFQTGAQGCDMIFTFQPPWASTTWRHAGEILVLLSCRQASICCGLPTNCEQKAWASLRQAIFSCMLGADSANACEPPAM